MSLKDPYKSPGSIFGAPLIGACLSVVCSVFVSSYAASLFGDTYQDRALIYIGFLLWTIAGAVTIFIKTYQKPAQRITARYILLWFASSWLWPLLIAAPAMKKRS